MRDHAALLGRCCKAKHRQRTDCVLGAMHMQVIRYNRVDDVRKWHALEGSVLIVSYEKLVADLKDKTKRAQKQASKQARKARLSATLSESNALAQVRPPLQARLCQCALLFQLTHSFSEQLNTHIL